MPFQKGHPAYPRRVRTEDDLPTIPLPDLPSPRRWAIEDYDLWLQARLEKRYGSAMPWRQKLVGFAASNDFLFVTNQHATILALVQRHVMTGQPWVQEVFAWARDADLKDDVYETLPKTLPDAALKALYRHVIRWTRDAGGNQLIVGMCSDMTPSRMLEAFGAHYLVRVRC